MPPRFECRRPFGWCARRLSSSPQGCLAASRDRRGSCRPAGSASSPSFAAACRRRRPVCIGAFAGTRRRSVRQRRAASWCRTAGCHRRCVAGRPPAGMWRPALSDGGPPARPHDRGIARRVHRRERSSRRPALARSRLRHAHGAHHLQRCARCGSGCEGRAGQVSIPVANGTGRRSRSQEPGLAPGERQVVGSAYSLEAAARGCACATATAHAARRPATRAAARRGGASVGLA